MRHENHTRRTRRAIRPVSYAHTPQPHTHTLRTYERTLRTSRETDAAPSASSCCVCPTRSRIVLSPPVRVQPQPRRSNERAIIANHSDHGATRSGGCRMRVAPERATAKKSKSPTAKKKKKKVRVSTYIDTYHVPTCIRTHSVDGVGEPPRR